MSGQKVTPMLENQYSVRREYFVSPGVTPQWLEKAVAQISSACTPITYFNGSCELDNDYQDNINVRSLEGWAEYIHQHWAEMATSWARLSSENCTLSFHCDYKKSFLDFEVASVSIDESNAILGKLEENLELMPRKEAHNRSAVKMRYFAPSPLLQWFETFVANIKSSWASMDHFNGSYDLRSYFYGERIQVEILEDWVSSIQQNWPKIAESRAWFYSGNQELSFGCDHRRSLIDLEVRSPSIETSKDLLADMQKRLDLTQVEEDPYRYRKSAAAYKIGDWNKKSFTDATRSLLKEHFHGQEPAISDAYVSKVLDENIERLQGFYDINSYLDFIEESDESAIEWAQLTVEGADGLAIGISLSKKEKRLEIRSNVPPNELEEKVVKHYKEPLQLKVTKGELTGSAISSTTQPKAEKWWVKYVVQISLAIFGTSGIALMLTFARSYLTDYALEITFPIQSPAVVNSPNISLNWYLWPKDPFLHGPDYQAPATIIILHQGATAGEFDNATPPFTLQLKDGEGDYVVEVRPQRKAQPARVVISYTIPVTDTQGTSP
jgi:hypothetical protein